ncbi:MAG: hypothetical protein JO202_19570 [Ktedonobacteraceae bacterium]|nr:hypothetical protein [Ktedonobacteraceae bacterium]
MFAASMTTARDRHYDPRSARLVTCLVVAAALPQPCKKVTRTYAPKVARAFLSQQLLSTC